MQAPALAGVVEQGSFSTRFDRVHSGGESVAGKTTVQLNSSVGRLSACSCTKGDSEAKSGKREKLGLKPSLSTGSSGAAILHSIKSSKVPGCQTKAGWTLPRCFWRETADQRPSTRLEKRFDAVKSFTSRVLNHDVERKSVGLPDPLEEVGPNSQRTGSTLAAIAVSLMVLASPGPTLTNSSVTLSYAARADQLGQLRQAASLLEKAAEALPRVRVDPNVGLQVLDKAVTVVTGSTFVIDPKVLDEEVDAILSGEKDAREEVQSGIMHAGEKLTSAVLDFLTNFNPGALLESGGASVSAFLETAAERMAAFELSALVSLGERWLILTPLLVLPMAWEMNRLNKKNEREKKEGQEKFELLSGEATIKGERVRRELERIELRSSLLEAVSSLGKDALEPPRVRQEAGLIRRSIKQILERLEDLNPVEEPLLLVPQFASTLSSNTTTPGEALSNVPTSPTVDGDWRLIYISESNEASGSQELPQLPGLGFKNLRQKVWQSSEMNSLEDETTSLSPLRTRNTAEIRIGSLGVFQVGVEGSWENLKAGKNALVSFKTFSARPLEILGRPVSDDIPHLSVSLPPVLQRSAEWTVAYIDNYLRLNRGSRGQLFVFSKIE